MKPNFALKLSNDGIELLHRDSGGWLSLGSVSFETDDVQAGCAKLVAEANRLAPDGIRTKLVLPNSQLRYATVLAPGPTDEARRYQIEAEIEALTPYSIDELIYDWSVEDDYALIVICAKETLSEAEGFCEASGFNPVSFVAAPEPGQFIGEPKFGVASVASMHMPAGETVQFDLDPVVVTGTVPRPAAAAAAAAAPVSAAPGPSPRADVRADTRSSSPAVARPAPNTAAKAAPNTAPNTEAKAAPRNPATKAQPAARLPGARPKVEVQPRPIEPSRTPNPLAADPVASEPLSKVGNLVRRMGTRLRREQAQDAPVAKSAVAPVASQAPAAAARPAPAPVAASVPAAAPAPRPVAIARPAPVDAAAVTGAATAGPVASGDAAAPISFASRRRQAPVVATSGDGAADGANPGGRLAVMPGQQQRQRPSFATRLKRKIKRTARQTLGRASAGGNAKAQAAVGAGANVAAPPIASPERRRVATVAAPVVANSRPPASEREKATEAEAMTIFGARGNTQTERSLAGRGLLVGGGVAMLLVAVAVWFIYFNGDDPTIDLAGTDPTTTGSMPQIAAPDRITTGATGATGVTATLDDPATNAGAAPAGAEAGQTGDTGTLASLSDTSGNPDDVATRVEAALNEALQDPAAEGGAGLLPDTSGFGEDTGTTSEAGSVDPVLGDTQLATQIPVDTPAVTNPETAAAPGDAATTDPDRLLESLVQEALNEALPAETLDRAEQITQESSQTASDASAAPQPNQLTAQVAGSEQTSAAAPGQTADTPQLAAAATTATRRMSLPGGFDVPRLDEVAFSAPAAPAPFGTEFSFDDNGLIEATPEGALTPSGVTVFARRPDIVPAPRPAGIAPQAALTPEPAPAPEPEPAPVAQAPSDAVPDDTPRADPALAEARPLPRSDRVRALGEQLAPQTPEPEPDATGDAQGDAQQDAALAPSDATNETTTETTTAALETPPPGGVSLAALRPQTRPTDLVPPALLPDPDLENADATPEAVTASLRPSARPDDVSERGRAALAAAGSGGSTPPRADVEDQAGETASAAAQPVIPTSASVAEHATDTNAIDLRDVNLIGVFGTTEDRRALVRLSSGRVVRVQVGDRLDGGRVTAIGDTELRYTRRGRNEILEIGG